MGQGGADSGELGEGADGGVEGDEVWAAGTEEPPEWTMTCGQFSVSVPPSESQRDKLCSEGRHHLIDQVRDSTQQSDSAGPLDNEGKTSEEREGWRRTEAEERRFKSRMEGS